MNVSAAGSKTRPPVSGRAKAAFAYLFVWLGGALVLATSRKQDAFERWHAIQAVCFGVVWTLFMIPAILASVGLLGASPSDAIGLGLSLLGLLLFVTWFALIVVALAGRRLRLPGAARLADRFSVVSTEVG